MKLTIDISDDLFNGIVENKYGLYNGQFFDMIRGGTPVSEGHWIDVGERVPRFRCSECGDRVIGSYHKFCPHCGVKMRKELFYADSD